MIHRRVRAAALASKVFSFSVLIFLACSSNTLLVSSGHATTAAGRTPGAFNVSPTGAATYTIPIWAPRGPNGLQPNIALVYDSQVTSGGGTDRCNPSQGSSTTGGSGSIPAGRRVPAVLILNHCVSGTFGVGWSLSGLSSIYRCNLTFAQDAAPAPVSLVVGDGYCMDGQRLRLTGGTYGTAGSTYQTEVANFVNVTAYGAAGNGPSYFIAQDRNGRTYTYGDGGNSQVLATGSTTALSWQLNKVSDPSGNTMTIAYNTATGAAVPATISWTPTSYGASSYSYTMTFAYGTNVPQSSVYGYAAGTAVTNTNLLNSIAIAYSGTAIKTYYLTYEVSPTTARNELKQVQECAGSGTSNCFAPTTMTYQSGARGVSTTVKTALSTAVSYAHYDFNGDGYPDLLYASGSYWYVSFGSSSGFGTPVSTGIPSSVAQGQVLPGDLLGNGKDGILAAVGGTWYYYTWNGSAFTDASTGLAYDSTAAQYMLADVNGDGLPDLIASYFTARSGGGYNFQINERLTASNGTSVSFGSAVDAYSTGGALLVAAQLASNSDNAGGTLQTLGPLRRFDFNGDGRDDLSMQLTTSSSPTCGPPPPAPPPTGAPVPPPSSCTYTVSTSELISNGATFTVAPITSFSGSSIVPVAFLNFNSDACTDYLVGSTIYAGCSGSTPTTISLGSANVIGAMDWDGDGRTDILVQNGSTIGVYLSTGNGVSSLSSTSIPYSSANVYFTLDANADGLDDLGYWNSSGTYYYLHNGAGTPPDLLASVTDAFGNSASPTYVSLAQNNYTENGYGTPPQGYETYIGPMYVVNEATFSDPSSASGGTYNQTFWYYGAWTNLQGRGWQSFYGDRMIDSRSGLTFFQYFERSFPTTGIIFETTTSSGSVTTNLTSNALPSQMAQTMLPWLQSGTQYQERYFPYFSSTAVTQEELGGTENGDTITTANTSYTYDNYGNTLTIATTVTDNDPGSPYKTDTWTTTTTNTPDESTSPWCLSLLSKSQVAYTDSNNDTPVTITKTLTPDTTHCRYSQVVAQSNSGASYAVTEALAYDNFGNVNSDTVTGASMTPRVTTINWTTSAATTGQFPMNVTDPSGAQTQFNYNFSYGLISSVTDPNGLATSWLYADGFGRKTKETRPDGTYTAWAYVNCNGTTGCLVGPNGLVISHDVYNTNATVQSWGSDYLDQIDRPLMSIQIMMNGTTYSRNELRYDSLGRVSQRSFPCTYSALTTTCTYWTTNTYDVLNRLTQSQRPISSTNSNLQTTTYQYAGRTTTVIDPYSHGRVIVTDVNRWLRQTKDPYNYAVTLAYDAAGNKTAVTDSLSNSLWSETYNYGIAAFPKTTTDMDMGSWSYTYDALGERTAWTDAKGQSFSKTYDALSRPLTRTEPDLFTQWTWGTSATNHNIGKLQSVCTGLGASPTNCTSSPGYSESETYDNLARRATRAIIIPGQTNAFTYTWAYNPTTGLLNTLTYPVSTSSYALQLQYGYSSGILQTVTDVSDTPNVTVWQANTMNPAGQVTQETLGNGIVTTRSYDAVTGWLGTAQSGVGGGSAVKNLAFLFDEMGDVTQRQDNNLGLTENIYYDNDYRFSYSQLQGTQNLLVTYDNTGNITSRSDINSGATWTYDPVHKHEVTEVGSTSDEYTYDANGNALTRPGYSTMTWSSYNYPTSISTGYGPGWTTSETVGFAYGPNRQRWQQTYSGNNTTETTDYVGRLLQFVSSGGTLDYRHYIYGGTGAVAVYSRKSTGVNTFSYLLSDNQSSVASITNSSGAQVAGESFTAFGNRRNPTTWSGADTNSDLTTIAGITREGYTFQTALGLWSGLNHMKGRVEDAWSGRMLSADPTIPDPTSTQSYNRYSYVNNNPVTYSDPTGFDPDCDQCVKDDGSGGPLDEVTITASRESDSDPNATLGLTGSVAPSGGTSTSDPDKPKLEEVTVNGSRITPGKVPLVPILPQVSQQKAGCPSGLMGSIANQMNLWGKAAQKAGNLITNIGGTIVAAGAVGTFTAGPEIGLPVIGLGGTVAGIGSITTYTGIGIQAASGLITTAYGNNQPGVNATAQAAAAVVESLIDQKLGFPLTSIPGLTDPIDALVHRVSGVNPCPQ
jgi:RHS repeat-associated protein